MEGFIHIEASERDGIDCKCRLSMVTLLDQLRILLIVYQSLGFAHTDIVRLAPLLESMLSLQKADGNITTIEAEYKSDNSVEKILRELLGREDGEGKQ